MVGEIRAGQLWKGKTMNGSGDGRLTRPKSLPVVLLTLFFVAMFFAVVGGVLGLVFSIVLIRFGYFGGPGGGIGILILAAFWAAVSALCAFNWKVSKFEKAWQDSE